MSLKPELCVNSQSVNKGMCLDLHEADFCNWDY